MSRVEKVGLSPEIPHQYIIVEYIHISVSVNVGGDKAGGAGSAEVGN